MTDDRVPREEIVADVSMQILRLIDESPLKDSAERATALASALAAYCKLNGFDLPAVMIAFKKTWADLTVGEVKLQ